MTDYLVIRANGTPYALPVWDVLELIDAADILTAPVTRAAVRGLTPARGGLVPLVHLGALLAEGPAPPERGAATVLTLCAGRRVALEVDDVEAVVDAETLPLPGGWRPPCASAVARRAGRLLHVLDLDAVRERLTGAGAAEQL